MTIPEVRKWRLTREIGSLKPELAKALMSGVAMVDKRLAVMAYPRAVGPQSPGFALLDWNGELRCHITADEHSRTYVGIYNDGAGGTPTVEFEVKYNAATDEYWTQIANAHADSLFVTSNPAQFAHGILHIAGSPAPTTLQESADQALFIVYGDTNTSSWPHFTPTAWLTYDTDGEIKLELRTSDAVPEDGMATAGFDFDAVARKANCYTDYLKPAYVEAGVAYKDLIVEHHTAKLRGLVVNENGWSVNVYDFRVESGTETHMIHVDTTTDELFLGGAAGLKVSKGGYLHPVSSTDASAPNGTIYYSTTASKLVFKDSGGTVRNLY